MKTKEGLNPKSIKKYWKNLQPPDLNYLKATKNKFYDHSFPPTLNTLLSKNSKGEFVDKVRGPEQLKDIKNDIPNLDKLVWKRVTEVTPKWELFEGKIEFNDVQQGALGDCYFLSSITALTEYPYLIKEKFRTKSFNEEGYYEIIFFIDGEWQIVFIDDYLPYNTLSRNFAFALPNNNELWAMLLEKAWAKLNGGYSNIIGGIVSEPVSALTGFPTEYLSHKNYEDMEIFDKIEEGEKEGTIMSSASKNVYEVENKGLIRSHAYTLISAKKWKERNIYLIKLRNPWGEAGWKGKWGDNSPYWTDEYKRYFKYKKRNDGVFWIDINDYINNFDATYICYILYGAIVKNFYFEYQSYFKKPVVFNLKLQQKSKMSISVFFKNWRFNRDVYEPSHPFSILVGRYDNNRNIQKLWVKWSCKDDLNLIDFFEPGLYVIWLYLEFKSVNDPKFKYTVQVSSLNNFDIEFLGIDRDFLLAQYLLLENYKKTGINNLNSSKDYLIGTDKEVAKNGLNNILLYNKTGNEIQIDVTANVLSNSQLLPPYEGLKNIKINLPPYESIALIGIRLSNNRVNFSFSFRITMSPKLKEDGGNRKWMENKGSKFSNLLKLNIINNNPETMGLRTGEYKYIGKTLAHQMPKFDSTQFIGQTILQMSMTRTDKITLEKLKSLFPKEIELLMKKFPVNNLETDRQWDYIPSKDGKYAGQINIKSGNLDGKGVFIWNIGIKYIGNWKEGNMHGNGILFDKNNKFIFQGNFYHNKKYGKGKFVLRENEYYEGEFFDDKMEGKGCYHYSNGDTWEGYFKNNLKHGVGIMTYKISGDIYLYEFENDNYMGSTPLNPEEKEKVRNLQQEQRKKLLEKEKQKQYIINKENNGYNNNQLEQNDDLNKYTNTLFLQKSIFDIGVKISPGNKEVEESIEEKRHKTFLEKVELYKKKEPFMIQKLFDLKPLNYEEDLNLIENDGKKYLGGIIKLNNTQTSFIMQGRGVLFDKKYYYVGYWDKGYPNGFFYKYNKERLISFQGFLLKDYSINPKYKTIFYFSNGERYEGYFKDNKMNGFGIYYFSEGDSFTGNFVSGKFDGTGKIFYKNGFITEYITYKNGNIISKFEKMREDYRDPNSSNFFNDIRYNHPGIIEKILELPPIRDVKGELFWTKRIFHNGDIYIGQMKNNQEQELFGRCCFIYRNSPITYFVGYIINKEFRGEGCYYNYQWKKIYEGNFKHNLKNGFGILYKDDGSIYAGEFLNDIPNGKGVLYYPNTTRFEGHFLNGFQNGKGYLINYNKEKKQEIIYQNGNIIEQGKIYDYKRSKYKKKFKEEFDEFEKNCKKLGYEKYMNLMMNIKPTNDSYLLKKGIKVEIGGKYIGEMNSIGFKYGRGVFIEDYTNMYYVGYFVNNEKFGKGVNYYPDGKVQYIGEYRRNKTSGQGEFRYKNGDILQGIFNSCGEGTGVYTFSDGSYWKGTFYAWNLHGKGMLYDKYGKYLGEKNFEYNKQIG